MSYSVSLMRMLDVLEPGLKEVLWAILDEIEQQREASVTKNEFNELKEIVRDIGQTTKGLAKAQERTELRMEGLAKAQDRTEQKVENLSKAMEGLAEAQKRTEQKMESLSGAMEGLARAQERTEVKMEELAEAQKRTEQKVGNLSGAMEELAEAQKQTEKEMAKLSGSLHETREQTSSIAYALESEVGDLAKNMAYEFENEAFRKLPDLMRTRFSLDVREKLVRTFIRGEEINVFAKARRNGEEVLVVGEAVLRLDDRSKMAQLEKNMEAVKEEYGLPVVPLIITHFAHPDILRKAREQGVLIVQSFEWE